MADGLGSQDVQTAGQGNSWLRAGPEDTFCVKQLMCSIFSVVLKMVPGEHPRIATAIRISRNTKLKGSFQQRELHCEPDLPSRYLRSGWMEIYQDSGSLASLCMESQKKKKQAENWVVGGMLCITKVKFPEWRKIVIHQAPRRINEIDRKTRKWGCTIFLRIIFKNSNSFLKKNRLKDIKQFK